MQNLVLKVHYINMLMLCMLWIVLHIFIMLVVVLCREVLYKSVSQVVEVRANKQKEIKKKTKKENIKKNCSKGRKTVLPLCLTEITLKGIS